MSAAGEVPTDGTATRTTGLAKLGRYELIQRIGEGGMAEVQLALQRGPAGFEKLVVVKLVHDHLATQKTFVDMLLDEARVAALVKHPNVVDIYDLGEAEGRYFIAMEYLEGEPLLAVLRAGREGKRLDPLSTARLIADTAEGLEAAHELRSMGGEHIELVHHDVSLGNIVVLYNGQVKLVDFGVAKASLTTAGPTKIQGKFAYMAPEKLQGGAGDRRSDIWSLGVVLWEALTLRRLFKGGNDADTMKQVLEQKIPPPSEVNAEVLAAFDPIVMKALEHDPAQRYASARQLAEDLEDVLATQKYGRRNDQIAKYMQATFETHINARKKLLQEVSIKGRASAAILQAAFAEPAVSTRASTEFSIAFKATAVAEGTPARPSSRAIPVIPAQPASPERPTDAAVVEAQPVSAPAASAVVDEPGPIESSMLRPSRPPSQRGEPVMGTFAAPASKRPVVLVAVVLVVVVIVIAVIALAGSGSDSGAPIVEPPAAPAPGAAPPPDAAPAPVELPTAPADAAVTVAPRDAAHEAPRVMVTPPPPRPPVNLGELTATAVRELAAGKVAEAIATFKKATAASPGYAPAWRGLGIAYEKQGAKPQAIAALQRYLALSPTATDAAAIRERLERLKR